MEYQVEASIDGQRRSDEVPSAVLAIQPVVEPRPVGRRANRLPALVVEVGERLPALWNGGRGPLAQAVLAGGMLALGSVVGRLAAESRATALVPTTPPPPAAAPVARCTEVVVQTAIVETRRRWGRRTQRVQLVEQRIAIRED
jgi:hypothetical protein